MSQTDRNVIKNDTDNSLDNTEPSLKPARKARKSTAKFGSTMTLIAIILSTCTLVLSSYIGWVVMHLEESRPSIEEGVSQLQTHMARQQARLSDVIHGISPIKSHFDEILQRESLLLSRVDSLTRKIRWLGNNTNSQWQLAEVKYLLRLANQRLLTLTDAMGAWKLLVTADEILMELDDYSLFPIREALAKDMADLKSISNIDLEGIWLQLQGLKDSVPQLVLLNENRLSEVTPETTVKNTPITDSNNWQLHLKNLLISTWSNFADLFRFTANREQPIELLLSPKQDVLIRQELLLLLEQGKIALMTHDEAIYKSSLEKAHQLLKQYFTLGGRSSNILEYELQQLAKIIIAPELPIIHRSLEAMKRYESELYKKNDQKMQLETAEPLPTEYNFIEENLTPDALSSDAQTETTEPGQQNISPEAEKDNNPASKTQPNSGHDPISNTPEPVINTPDELVNQEGNQS